MGIREKFEQVNGRFFIYLLSERRLFISLLSVYFLTLPNTTAVQIGIFSGLGSLASFLLEIPSSYMADTLGHKRALLWGKYFQFISVCFFIVGYYLPEAYVFWVFALGSILQAFGFAFSSGTKSALFHELLEVQGDTKSFSKLWGKLLANVSLASAVVSSLIPLMTVYHILLPFYIGAGLDIIGMIMLWTIPSPKKEYPEQAEKKITQVIAGVRHMSTLYVMIFTAILSGIMFSEQAFRGPYMVELGMPIAYVGLVFGLSRIFRFIFGHYAHYIEKYLTMKQHLFIEILLFSTTFFLISWTKNAYIVGGLLAIIVGYKWGRQAVITGYIFDDEKMDKNYKATILSTQSQVTSILGIILAFVFGYVMNISYSFGYFVIGCLMLAGLSISYYFILRK